MEAVGTASRPYAPMTVIGDVNGDGLGLVSWWAGEDEPEAENGAMNGADI